MLANQAAAALENERLYRRASSRPSATASPACYNHRHFQERLRQECRRAHRYGTPLSLLMLDLDDFKAFNDQFGHQIGDEALREVGAILLADTRRGVDLAGAVRRRGVRRHPAAHRVPLGRRAWSAAASSEQVAAARRSRRPRRVRGCAAPR